MTQPVPPGFAPLLLEAIGNGETIRSFCRRHPDGPCEADVRRCLLHDPAFAQAYARASEWHADDLCAQLLEMVRPGANAIETAADPYLALNRLRARIESLKAHMVRVAPWKYDDYVYVMDMDGEKIVSVFRKRRKAEAEAEPLQRPPR